VSQENLSERDKEVLSLVTQNLRLDLSPEQATTKEGVVKIIQKLREEGWGPHKFHSLGIPVNSFRKACAKIGGGFNSYVPSNICDLFVPLTGQSLFL
jgi:hypothetical protein